MTDTYKKITVGSIAFLFFMLLFGFAWMFKRQRTIERHLLQQVALRTEEKRKSSRVSAVSTPVVQKVVSTAQLWRPVQEKVKDSVVQIFSQVAEFNWLEPYKTPVQHSSTGSGFFINDKGDLVTNAHVVNQATAIWIQIPSMGKRILDVELVGVSPERDLALLRLAPESLEVMKKELGSIPFLPLGDSDLVRRSDDVMDLGYPLGQQSLKSTTGVVSGTEQHYIQMSAAANPGSSGGPVLNARGEVIGILNSGIPGAQNVGYMIPINELKIILPDLYKIKLLRKPFLGVLFNNASPSLTEFLGNPQPGGCYVVEVVNGSTLDQAGVKRGDMIYEINGHQLDIFGEMIVPWSEDKISIIDYVSRLSIGEDVHLVVYRNGVRKEMTIKFSKSKLPSVRRVYPGYENIDYEIFGGMVVMELSLNHVHVLAQHATGLAKYAELGHQTDQALLITHIFPNSQLARTRTITPGSTINEVNGIEMKTLEDFRKAIRKGATGKFVTVKASDNVARASDNVFVVLPYNKLIEEEAMLSRDYKYQLTSLSKDLVQAAHASAATAHQVLA